MEVKRVYNILKIYIQMLEETSTIVQNEINDLQDVALIPTDECFTEGKSPYKNLGQSNNQQLMISVLSTAYV